jgi:hypothetical protein
MAKPTARRFDFWRFWGRSLMAGTDRLGSFSQRDRIVGLGILGAIVIGPLASGVVAVAFGLVALLIPSAIIAIVIVMFVCMSGAYGQWRSAEDAVAMKHDEALYYKGIIEGQADQAQKQAMQAALIDEAYALADRILAGGDAQLSDHRIEAQNWRERSRDFLVEHAYNGITDGAECYRSFERDLNSAVFRDGVSYGGDVGRLAAQVENMAKFMSHLTVPERYYGDYRTIAEEADRLDILEP